MSDTGSPSPVSDVGGLASPGETQAATQGMRVLVADGTAGRPRLPMLAAIIERLAEFLTVSFRTLSRGVDVRIGETQPIAFNDFVDAQSATALIAVLRVG